jgi:hypothetical protein
LLFLGLNTAGSAALAQPGQTPETNEIAPFKTDGCSLFPNGYWRDCCTLHDFAYWKGGTFKEKIESDAALNVCIVSKGAERDPIFRYPIAFLVFVGTFIGGPADFETPFRWGYGWKFDRTYLPLTPELQKLVDAATPADILAMQPEPLGINTKIFPSETGNYCADELYRLFAKYNAEQGKNLRFTYERERISDRFFTYAVQVQGEGCHQAEFTALFNVHTPDLCTQMVSREGPTEYFQGFMKTPASTYCPDFVTWYKSQR